MNVTRLSTPCRGGAVQTRFDVAASSSQDSMPTPRAAPNSLTAAIRNPPVTGAEVVDDVAGTDVCHPSIAVTTSSASAETWRRAPAARASARRARRAHEHRERCYTRAFCALVASFLVFGARWSRRKTAAYPDRPPPRRGPKARPRPTATRRFRSGSARRARPCPRVSAVTTRLSSRGIRGGFGFHFLPDGRIVVSERPGRIRIVDKDGTLSEPLAGLPQIYTRGPQGLFEVLPDRDFAKNRTLYLTYTALPAGTDAASAPRLAGVLTSRGRGCRTTARSSKT